MANARVASLLANRSRSLYNSSGSIRLLTPTNSSISSIAKQTAASELDIMVSKYNSGMVSNDEMKAFLSKMQLNPGMSAADRLNIDEQIREFDSRIIKDRLETAYKAAPQGSAQQIQSLQALSSYWRAKAGTMAQDTPAFATASDNVAQYDQKIIDVNNSMQIQNRRNQGYISLQEINKIADPVEKASKMADMYNQLYNQAVEDGDTVAANQYLANAEKSTTQAETLANSAAEKENKQKLSDFINETVLAYHGGQISGDQAIEQLRQADQFAADNGDLNGQMRLQGLYTTISNEITRGVTYSPDGTFGDKSKGGGSGGGVADFVFDPSTGTVSWGGTTGGVSSGGTTSAGKTGTTGGTTTTTKTTGTKVTTDRKPMTLTEMDIYYKNQLNAANKALLNGEIPAAAPDENVPIDKQPANYEKSMLLLNKDRATDMGIIVNQLQQIYEAAPNSTIGKKAKTALNTATAAYQNSTNDYNSLLSGRVQLAMKTTNGKTVIDFVPNSAVAGKNWVKSGGINYPTYDVQIGVDETGKPVMEKRVDIQDTSGRSISYQYDEANGMYLPMAVGPITTELRKKMLAEKAAAVETGQTYEGKLPNFQQATSWDKKSDIGRISGTIKPKALPLGLDNVLPVAKAVTDTAKSVINTVIPNTSNAVSVAPVAPKPVVLPANIPLGTSGQQAIQQAAAPLRSTGTTLPAPSINPASPAAPLKLATQTPSPLAKLTQQTKAPLVNIGTSPVKATPKAPQQSLNPIDFFKKLLGWK